MKKILFAFLLLNFPFLNDCLSQTVASANENNPTKQTPLDDLFTLSNLTNIEISSSEQAEDVIRDLKLFDLYSPEVFKQKLLPINDYNSLYFIFISYTDKIQEMEISRRDNPEKIIDVESYKNQLNIIVEKLDALVGFNFVHYTFSGLKNRKLKAVNIYHDNDAFLLPIKNQDRNYTGGARIEFVTDYLGLRTLNLFWDRSILNYQSIFVGGEAFTPQIRYDVEDVQNATGVELEVDPTTDKLNEYSIDAVKDYLSEIHLNDRPFASYFYVGKSQYRVQRLGNWRLKSDILLGVMGKEAPRQVQDFLHRDIIVQSQKVLLWENQIANGGRFAFNFDWFLDYSMQNIDKFKDNKFLSKAFFHGEVRLGSYITAIAGGIGWSNKKLNESSYNFDLQNQRVIGKKFGIKNKTARQLKKNIANHLLLQADIKARYVFHNSALEGVGIINTYSSDQYDDDVTSVYTLKAGEINRLLFLANFTFAYRFDNSTFYYRQTFITKEFNKEEAMFYGWGTVGFNFHLDY